MTAERNPRKRAIASAISTSGGQATIDDAGRRYPTAARATSRCNETFVVDITEGFALWIRRTTPAHVLRRSRQALDCRESFST
jgi:hypothetical protein